MKQTATPLEIERAQYAPEVPNRLKKLNFLKHVLQKTPRPSIDAELQNDFPHTYELPLISFQTITEHPIKREKMTVGVVLSGGQAPGGHNVISGLYDALKSLHPENRLIGFLNGPIGIIKNQFIEIDNSRLEHFRNQGGFDLLGSGRDKIETKDQFELATQTVLKHKLTGLCIIGGDDSNTNAAHLAEYFLAHFIECNVVGVPKTIDGDLKNEYIPCSFGFDSCSKVYSEFIGNIAKDALSQRKYTFFIKLMGRSSSHVALECALETHPNIALIGEEIEKKGLKLKQISDDIADIVQKRAENNKNYGIVLIPEGILEFIPEFKALIRELNQLLSKELPHLRKIDEMKNVQDKISYLKPHLSKDAISCLEQVPETIAAQLFMERDPHGNLQVSRIESERFFIELVSRELNERKKRGQFKGKFAAVPLFCGYEGRSGFPSNFDANYTYSLGMVAALLLQSNATGYMACIRNLHLQAQHWEVMGVPLVSMMHFEERQGKKRPVIAKAYVNLDGHPFRAFAKARNDWAIDDDYRYPGPTQLFGPQEITNRITNTLRLESES